MPLQIGNWICKHSDANRSNVCALRRIDTPCDTVSGDAVGHADLCCRHNLGCSSVVHYVLFLPKYFRQYPYHITNAQNHIITAIMLRNRFHISCASPLCFPVLLTSVYMAHAHAWSVSFRENFSLVISHGSLRWEIRMQTDCSPYNIQSWKATHWDCFNRTAKRVKVRGSSVALSCSVLGMSKRIGIWLVTVFSTFRLLVFNLVTDM